MLGMIYMIIAVHIGENKILFIEGETGSYLYF